MRSLMQMKVIVNGLEELREVVEMAIGDDRYLPVPEIKEGETFHRLKSGQVVITSTEVKDTRPANCRNRLRDEGKPYPKSSCYHCGTLLIPNHACRPFDAKT